MWGGNHIYDGRAWQVQLRERLGTYFLGNPGWGMMPAWAGSFPSQFSNNPNFSGPEHYRDALSDWTVGYPNVLDNRVFYGQGYYRTGSVAEPTKVLEFARPTFMPSIHHFEIWYVDATGSGDFDVSIDGGAYFTVVTAKAHDHGLKFVTVNQRVQTIVKIRPHTTSVFVSGGLRFFARAQGSQDCLVDCYAKPGELLTDFVADMNQLDWLDVVQPHLIIMEFANDIGGLPPPPVITLANYAAALATWQASLQDVIDRVSSYADVLIFGSYEQNRHFVRSEADDIVIQNAFRQGAHDVANANTNVACLDLFAAFGGSFANGVAAGLIEDYAHPSATGHDLIANLVYSVVGAGATRASVTPSIAPTASDVILDRTYRGVRSDGFVFNLVTADRQQLGALDVFRDTTPTVRNDTSRRSYRTVEGFTATNKPSDLDLRRHRMQVLMTLQNGETFPFGVFMFGQNDTEVGTGGDLWSPQLFDENFLLDQNLGRSWSIAKGGSVLGFFRAMAGEVLDPLDIPTSYSVSDIPSASPLAFLVGTSRLDALRSLAARLACVPPYFANDGTFTLKQAPQVDATSTMDHIYEAGPTSRIFRNTVRTSDTLYKAPNLYIVVGDQLGSGVPVRGTYSIPASAPHSRAQIGYDVAAEVHSVPGVSSPDIAAEIARIDAITDRTQYRTASFSATADPRHDTYETVQLLGSPFIETAWSLQCAPGGAHEHQLAGLWT